MVLRQLADEEIIAFRNRVHLMVKHIIARQEYDLRTSSPEDQEFWPEDEEESELAPYIDLIDACNALLQPDDRAYTGF